MTEFYVVQFSGGRTATLNASTLEWKSMDPRFANGMNAVYTRDALDHKYRPNVAAAIAELAAEDLNGEVVRSPAPTEPDVEGEVDY